MRFLLLLSALFTALAGVTGTRAMAQPMQASAATGTRAAVAAVVAPVSVRMAAPAFGWIPPLQRPLPRLIGAVAGRLLYAERRRE